MSYNLELTKAIQEIIKKQAAFSKSVDSIEEVLTRIDDDFEMKLKQKKDELSALEAEYNNTAKLRKLELDLAIKEHGYTQARQILEDRNEVPINMDELEHLREENLSLKREFEDKLTELRKKEEDRSKKSIAMMKNTMELEKKAELALQQARIQTQESEIELLKSTVAGLKEDLEAQRTLTRDVAQASANASVANSQQYRGVNSNNH